MKATSSFLFLQLPNSVVLTCEKTLDDIVTACYFYPLCHVYFCTVAEKSKSEDTMLQFSARNQLKGRIKDIVLGNIMAEIIVQLPDGQEVVSLITYPSSERLNLQIHDEVVVMFNSTDVLVGKVASD